MVPALGVLALAMGLASIPVGVWLLRASRLPAWMTGIWKWPLGDNVTPTVLHLQGWAFELTGVAALVAALVVVVPHRAVVFGGLIGMFLAGAATFAWVWSVALSRRR